MTTVESPLLSNCFGLTDLFFEEEEELETVLQCRRICINCPLFQECLVTGVSSFEDHPEGIMAGYPRSARQTMSEGRAPMTDWRETWDPTRRVIDGMPEPTLCRRHTPEGGICTSCGTRVRFLARR